MSNTDGTARPADKAGTPQVPFGTYVRGVKRTENRWLGRKDRALGGVVYCAALPEGLNGGSNNLLAVEERLAVEQELALLPEEEREEALLLMEGLEPQDPAARRSMLCHLRNVMASFLPFGPLPEEVEAA